MYIFLFELLFTAAAKSFKLAPTWDAFENIFMMKCKPIMIKILSASDEL